MATVRWADPALEDLERIVAFIARRNPGAALRLHERVNAKASSLKSLATRGRVVPELQRVGITRVRELVLPPYRLLYIPTRATVLIVAFFDARRDLEEVIFERYLDAEDSSGES